DVRINAARQDEQAGGVHFLSPGATPSLQADDHAFCDVHVCFAKAARRANGGVANDEIGRGPPSSQRSGGAESGRSDLRNSGVNGTPSPLTFSAPPSSRSSTPLSPTTPPPPPRTASLLRADPP